LGQGGRRGILYVISAPSGTGKSTLAHKLLGSIPGMEFSVSYTTRPRRPGEENGREYHFVDDARFDAMIAEGAFLEWAHVFDHRYGTGRQATERALDQGRDLLLDIDVQGGRQVRERAEDAVFIFVLPPDYATLESRLRERGSEPEEAVRRRLTDAREEVGDYVRYDYLVINDDLDRAVAQLAAIVAAERRRVRWTGGEVEKIVRSFPRDGVAGDKE
jgi:guanylate kinase